MKILAIDLGKFKSVACVYESTTGEHSFTSVSPHEPRTTTAGYRRNAAIAVCRAHHYPAIAAAGREFAWNPSRLFAILGFLKL